LVVDPRPNLVNLTSNGSLEFLHFASDRGLEVVPYFVSLGLGGGSNGGGNNPQDGTANNVLPPNTAANYATTNSGRTAASSAYSSLAAAMEMAARLRASSNQLPQLANTAVNGRQPVASEGKSQIIYQAHIYGPVTISDVQEPNEFLRALTKLSFGEKQ